jgi:hypothetical protein
MSTYDEDRLSGLIAALPPAPEAWLLAAQELPFVRTELDAVVAKAEADAEFRRELIADLEATLAREGYEPDRPLVDALRRHFTDS